VYGKKTNSKGMRKKKDPLDKPPLALQKARKTTTLGGRIMRRRPKRKGKKERKKRIPAEDTALPNLSGQND